MDTLPARRRSPMAVGVLAAIGLAVAVAVAVAESRGWPFLAQPLQRTLSQQLGRELQITGADGTGFRLQLFGSVRLSTPRVFVAAPGWSRAPHLLLARDATFEWGWGDLWRAWRGAPLHTRLVQATSLDLNAERRADGTASWTFGSTADGRSAGMPSVGQLRVAQATWRFDDLRAQLTLKGEAAIDGGLHVQAEGRYRDAPVRGALAAPSLAASATLTAHVEAGRARFDFEGSAAALPSLDLIDGSFRIVGPSLAAVGDPVGVTLPTTGPFAASGRLRRDGPHWELDLSSATVGRSALGGRFVYDAAREVPMLSGRLVGRRLLLADLGPVVGAAPEAPRRAPGRVLPDRPFDLASLRVMDADVEIDIAEVDLNTRWLEPMHPLRAQLRLAAGVLVLSDLDARTAQGSLKGSLHLDGRGREALWLANLKWAGLRLEDWLRADEITGREPYASGRMEGTATLHGRGLSTATILGALQGRVYTRLHDGTLSHLVVEAAGLDVAQALGVMIGGDEALPVSCAVADLDVAQGVMTPRVFVVDTPDSTILVDGTLSLAREQLDLRAVVTPRDFSPLALRTPLRVGGSFAAPEVSVETGKLAGRVAASVLLALVNPLAALLPLLDPGDNAAATEGAAGCAETAQRAARRSAGR